MTDIEMTRLCVQAMGDFPPTVEHGGEIRFGYASCLGPVYRPIHDDAQAMALVKKFRLGINAWSPDYQVWVQNGEITPEQSAESCTFNVDLNRAIVECVAKMQATRPVGPEETP